MIETIALVVYLSQLVALARSRGRSALWALGGLLVWAAGDLAGWLLAPHDPLLSTAVGLPLALLGACAYYLVVRALPVVEHHVPRSLGNNFPCPLCASLQTEDRSGHLACHGCGHGYGAYI